MFKRFKRIIDLKNESNPPKNKNEKEAREIMSFLGVSPEGVDILSPKSIHTVFKNRRN